MMYISIDGDDIGRRIAAMHLFNDDEGLRSFVMLVQDKVTEISHLLTGAGYTLIFCAADGVVAHKERDENPNFIDLYARIEAIGGENLTFSAGVGQSLREAYVALLAAKNSGKARLCDYSEMT